MENLRKHRQQWCREILMENGKCARNTFDIAEKVKESGMQSPAVIVIGETAEMEL